MAALVHSLFVTWLLFRFGTNHAHLKWHTISSDWFNVLILVDTNPLTNGSMQFLDTVAANFRHRFLPVYRALTVVSRAFFCAKTASESIAFLPVL